ncbi:MAG: Ig-like domain-containing protein, partial [Verrucomicrobiota bacterium]
MISKAVYGALTFEGTTMVDVSHKVRQEVVNGRQVIHLANLGAGDPAGGSPKSTFGDHLTFTATVGGAKPVGKVTFYDGEVPLESQIVNPSGTASLVTDVFAGGTHPLSARYEGDPENSPTPGSKPTLTIGDLTVGHTYRLQVISNLPRNGVVEVAGSKHQLANGEVKTPALLTATWVASNDTLNLRWIGQVDPSNPVHFTAYALHDMGPAKADENNKDSYENHSHPNHRRKLGTSLRAIRNQIRNQLCHCCREAGTERQHSIRGKMRIA